MKKTLLVAAATLAVGSFASQAQVYSQNIVGYYNVSLTGNQFALLSGQLLNSDGSNSVNNVLGSGLTSQSALALFWDPSSSTFTTYTYYNAADASPSPGGFYDINGNLSTNLFAPGKGAFIQDPNNTTITVVGTVPQGGSTNTVGVGFNIYSINAPISTNIDSGLVNFPATSQQDQLLLWTGSSYNPYTYYNDADAGGPGLGGWYDINGNLAPYPTVGSAFFIEHFGSTATWTNSFSF